MQIARRLDAPAQKCIADQNCPAMFSTSSGDLAFIGRTASSELRNTLPADTGIGQGEDLFVVPFEVLISAGWNPPSV